MIGVYKEGEQPEAFIIFPKERECSECFGSGRKGMYREKSDGGLLLTQKEYDEARQATFLIAGFEALFSMYDAFEYLPCGGYCDRCKGRGKELYIDEKDFTIGPQLKFNFPS